MAPGVRQRMGQMNSQHLWNIREKSSHVGEILTKDLGRLHLRCEDGLIVCEGGGTSGEKR